jgi:hypothetical protein
MRRSIAVLVLLLSGCDCSSTVDTPDAEVPDGRDGSVRPDGSRPIDSGPCDSSVDDDFDGVDQCMDCDDANGGIYPSNDEACNGIDEDCDERVDEDFDQDGDDYATCTTDPIFRDCDDTMASVHPGGTEDCGADGQGNAIDEDCDGYVDDGCAPCEPVDGDGDSVSECLGDCDDADPTVAPGMPEECDGRDTDCNIYTTRNCAVSQPCNFESGADDCETDLLCGCVVNMSGTCLGEYVCTSFCSGSFTGPLGSGCTDTQTCSYRISPTDNQHGCAETTDPVGTLGAGAECTSDAECRSLNCARACIGPRCSDRCVDYCDHHEPNGEGSCAEGTVCTIVTGGLTQPAMYATCLTGGGSADTGASCDGGCIWGAQSCVDGTCAEPCGNDAHCPDGFHCSLLGNALELGTFGGDVPEYIAGEQAAELVPVCLADGSGSHDRQAGAACTSNGECDSEMCESTLRSCLGLCTSDESCPSGLTCEPQHVRVPSGIVLARVCVSGPIDALLEPM